MKRKEAGKVFFFLPQQRIILEVDLSVLCLREG
jgi:hypothetical protein